MIEKRKDKRVQEENRIFIEIPGKRPDEHTCINNALTRDISLGGARIMTDKCFPAGSTLNMTLFLSRSKQIIRIRAMVRWSHEIEPGLFEMGVQFEHGVPTSVTALLNHLYRKEQTVPTHVNS